MLQKHQFPRPGPMGRGGCGHLVNLSPVSWKHPKPSDAGANICRHLMGAKSPWNSTCGHSLLQGLENRLHPYGPGQSCRTPGSSTRAWQDPSLGTDSHQRRAMGEALVGTHNMGINPEWWQMMIRAGTSNGCWRVHCDLRNLLFIPSLILLVSSKGNQEITIKSGS